MSQTIILNRSNIDPNRKSRLIYRFPNTQTLDKHTIALKSISIYHSFYNISAAYGNNTFSFIFNHGGGSDTYNWIIPDGYYSVENLHAFLKAQMYLNNLYTYTISDPTEIQYYCSIDVSGIEYGSQIRVYQLPNTTELANLGYAIPAAATWITHATNNYTPQMVITTANFGSLLGFSPATYPTTSLTENTSFLSDIEIQIDRVSDIMMTNSLINSNISIPSTLQTSITLSARYGSMIQQNDSNPTHNKISAGQYSTFEVELFDQNFQPLNIRDTQLSMRFELSTNK